jgi:hypothetical protein
MVASAPRRWLDRALNLDFARAGPAAILSVIYLLVRLPWLWSGYGAETDAYRVALVALHLRQSGEYLPSRLPGYPVHELLMAPLVWLGGSVATNLATALVSLFGVLIFAGIARAVKAPAAGLLVIAFAFTPFLIVNSVATKDYMWALSFLLAAYLASIRRRPVLAGVLLGLGAGCRITTAAFALPLLVLYLTPRPPSLERKGEAGRIRSTPLEKTGEQGNGKKRDGQERNGEEGENVAPGSSALKRARFHRPWRPPGPWRSTRYPLPAIRFLGALVATTFVVFLPVTLQYGTRFWNYADSRISPDIVIRSIGQYSIGAFGALAMLMALALSWRGLARLPRLIRADVHVQVWVATLALYFLAFARLPIDIAYLIPVYPFAYLLLSRIMNRYLLAGVVVVILCSGLIDLDISQMHNFNLQTFARTARPCRSCAEIFHDWHARTLYRNYASELGRTPVPAHSVVLTGGVFPDFAVINWNRFQYGIIDRDRAAVSMLSDEGVMRDTAHDVLYLASPRRPEVVAALRAQGYQIFKSDPSGPAWQVRLTPEP